MIHETVHRVPDKKATAQDLPRSRAHGSFGVQDNPDMSYDVNQPSQADAGQMARRTAGSPAKVSTTSERLLAGVEAAGRRGKIMTI